MLSSFKYDLKYTKAPKDIWEMLRIFIFCCLGWSLTYAVASAIWHPKKGLHLVNYIVNTAGWVIAAVILYFFLLKLVKFFMKD